VAIYRFKAPASASDILGQALVPFSVIPSPLPKALGRYEYPMDMRRNTTICGRTIFSLTVFAKVVSPEKLKLTERSALS
jgi:hypothetical protein